MVVVLVMACGGGDAGGGRDIHYLNNGLVLLGDHEAGGEGRAEHVDKEVVGEHVQLLHLLALHVHVPRHAEPAGTSTTHLISSQQHHVQYIQ